MTLRGRRRAFGLAVSFAQSLARYVAGLKYGQIVEMRVVVVCPILIHDPPIALETRAEFGIRIRRQHVELRQVHAGVDGELRDSFKDSVIVLVETEHEIAFDGDFAVMQFPNDRI